MIMISPQKRPNTCDHFIEDKRKFCVLTNRQTFLVRGAWSFDIHIHILEGVYNTNSLMRKPTGIRIGNKDIACL